MSHHDSFAKEVGDYFLTEYPLNIDVFEITCDIEELACVKFLDITVAINSYKGGPEILTPSFVGILSSIASTTAMMNRVMKIQAIFKSCSNRNVDNL